MRRLIPLWMCLLLLSPVLRVSVGVDLRHRRRLFDDHIPAASAGRALHPCLRGDCALFEQGSGSHSTQIRDWPWRTAGALVMVFCPIVLRVARGIDTKRMMYVSIFAPDWLKEHRGDMGSAGDLFMTFFDNLWLHLRPSYLFGIGDPNLRHSAHIVGQLSPLDILAVILAVAGFSWVALLSVRQMSQRTAPRWPHLDESEQMLVAVARRRSWPECLPRSPPR